MYECVLGPKITQIDSSYLWLLPYPGNTNDLLLTGLIYWGNPHMDILKIRLTTYDLRRMNYGLRVLPKTISTVFSEISRIEHI